MKKSNTVSQHPEMENNGHVVSRRSFLGALSLGAVSVPMLPKSVRAKEKCVADPSMRMVPTLTGPLPPEKLGTMLIHEHVLWGPIPEEARERSVDIAVGYLQEAARVGIDSLACLSPDRDMRLYAQIAERSPVKIVVSTGSYLYSRSSPAIQQMNEQQLFERVVREGTEGIDGTKIKAGIIKVAASKSPLTDWERAAFRATGRAQRETGLPVCTHAVFAPREQFDLLVASGADPRRCFFSHPENKVGWAGRNLEQHADYLVAIAKEGGSLMFNNFGLVNHTAWRDLVYMIRQLCDRGCMDRVLMSIDLAWEWINGNPVIQHSDRYPEIQPRTYSYMMIDVVPSLLKAGFSAQDVRTFLVDNPRRFFGGNV
jgi:phosphotriesterase-related protein